MTDTFGGITHGDKYATHIPLLQEMYRAGNPFVAENPAYVWVYQQDQVARRFWRFPVFSWSILPFMGFQEKFGLEFVVRSVLTLQGVLLLFALFWLFRTVYDTEIALYGTALVAANELLNLVSYVTVLDLPALVFTVFALVLYWRDSRNLAYLCCGFAALMKYSFFLIATPALGILILLNDHNKLYNGLKLGFFTLLPVFVFRLILAPSGGGPVAEGARRLAVSVFVVALSLAVFARYDDILAASVRRIDERVRHALVVLIPLAAVVLLWDMILSFAPAYLTDRYLLFNLDVYLTIIDQIRGHVLDVLFYFAPLGVFWVLWDGDRTGRRTMIALLGAVVFFGVVASKSVFPHAYYKHVFVIVVVLGFLGVLDGMSRIDASPRVVASTKVLLVVLLLVASQGTTTALFAEDVRGTEEMGRYIDRNVPEDELVIISTPAGRLMAIYSDARLTSLGLMKDWERSLLRDEIRSKGFGAALRDLDVTYYLSVGPGEFEEFEHLLTNRSRENLTGRTRHILQETDPGPNPRTNGVPLPEEHFRLANQSGDWYLYEIRPANETNSSSARR